MRMISKGNGKNYYLMDDEGIYHEIVRMGGLFYRTKYVAGEGLRPVGNPIKHSEFTLVE